MTTDVNVVLINFPAKGNEMVVPNEDGSYTILINARLSEEGRMLAYQHAMRHIAADDFQKEEIQTIEAQAHELLDSAKDVYKRQSISSYTFRISLPSGAASINSIWVHSFHEIG